MKVNYATREVETSESQYTKAITLSSNAKAFRVLFDRIYPDIIKAIVRELFTNAWDSQKIAGNLETPIDIHIPTPFEPYFAIRDYGVGMSPELIDEIYTNMFVSSKDQSNEEAGLFGLGSKTPLGLVDSFTLMSYIDGTFWYYEIYLNELGCPILSRKATGSTDEPNGVYVQLPVAADQFDKFKNYVELFAFGANTPIKINKEKYLEHYEITSKGKDWEFVDSPKIKSMHIRMGCVLYKIDGDFLINAGFTFPNPNKNYYSIRNGFNQTPLIIDFDIGDFEVTASREDIIYNDETVEKFKEKFNRIVDEYSRDITKRINNADCYYDAVQIWDKHRENFLFDSRKTYYYGALKIHSKITFKNDNWTIFRPYMNSHTSYSKMSMKAQYDYDLLEYHNLRFKRYIVVTKETGQNIKHEMRRVKNLKIITRCDKIFYVVHKGDYCLKKLAVRLPKSTLWVNLEDIEPLPYPKKEKEELNYLFKLNLNMPDSRYHDDILIEDGMIYVEMTRSKFDEEERLFKICKYLDTLDKKPSVAIVKKSNKNMIKKYKMRNIFDYYDSTVQKLTFKDEVYVQHAIVKMKETDSFANNVMVSDYFVEEYLKKKFPTFDNNKGKKLPYFDENINSSIYKRWEEVYDEVKQFFEDFLQKNLILKHISSYEVRYNLKEIMETIEEMKKQ